MLRLCGLMLRLHGLIEKMLDCSHVPSPLMLHPPQFTLAEVLPQSSLSCKKNPDNTTVDERVQTPAIVHLQIIPTRWHKETNFSQA